MQVADTVPKWRWEKVVESLDSVLRIASITHGADYQHYYRMVIGHGQLRARHGRCRARDHRAPVRLLRPSEALPAVSGANRIRTVGMKPALRKINLRCAGTGAESTAVRSSPDQTGGSERPGATGEQEIPANPAKERDNAE